MKRYLFILAALAFAVLSGPAEAACAGTNCFWIGGTGTLDLATDSAHWATTSGGATCSCEPATTDTITFDGNSGTGTVTVNIAGGTWTAASLTTSAFTGSSVLDFATNNNNVTLATSFTDSGTGTHTINLGNGTWSLTGASALWNVANANLTLVKNSSTISYTNASPAAQRRFVGGGKSYNVVSVVGSSTSFPFVISTSPTIATLTVSAPNRVLFTQNTTTTITTLTNVSGSSSNQTLFSADGGAISNVATISSANNWTCDWCGLTAMTFSGGGTFTGTNSFNFGGVTGMTITAPSSGGGGKII